MGETPAPLPPGTGPAQNVSGLGSAPPQPADLTQTNLASETPPKADPGLVAQAAPVAQNLAAPPLPDLPDISESLPSVPQATAREVPTASQPPSAQSGEVSLVSSELPKAASAKPPTFGRKKIMLPALALLAVLAGGTFFVFQRGMDVEEQTFPTEQPTPTVATTVLPASPLILTVESPLEGVIVKDAKLAVSGKTSANTVVALFTDASEDSLQTGGSGSFETMLTLVVGINELSLLAVSERGEVKSETRSITYEATNAALAKEKPRGTKKALYGTITGVNGPVVTLLEKPDTFYTVTEATGSGATIKGVTPASLASLKPGVSVVVVGDADEEGSMFAKLIHVMAQR